MKTAYPTKLTDIIFSINSRTMRWKFWFKKKSEENNFPVNFIRIKRKSRLPKSILDGENFPRIGHYAQKNGVKKSASANAQFKQIYTN